MKMLFRLLSNVGLIVSFGLLSLPLKADEIRLKNGDTLTGEIVKKENEKVILKTAYAGEISILWSEVENVESDKPLKIVLSDNSSFDTALKPSEPGKATIKLAKVSHGGEISLADLKYINPSPQVSGVGVDWSGRINLGGAFTKGNTDTGLLRLDAEAIARTKTNRYTIGAIVNRADSDGIDTEFNSRVYMKYDHFLNEKWYLYANNSLENDKFRDIHLRSSIGAGSGYQLFEQAGLNLSVEGGVNYINTEFYTAETESYPAARMATKFDKLLFGTTEFFQENEFLFGSANTLAFTKTGLRFPLSEQLHASTQYNYDWSKNPAPGRASADSALIFSLGYDW